MWKGGDGYVWSGSANVQASGQGMDTILQDYLTAHNPYTPFTDGREP
jgi:5'-nucleotidase / UDP-sugar diphosphatase